MKTLKKTIVVLSITFLTITAFTGAYFKTSNAVYCYAEGSAETNLPNIDMSWTQTTNESQLVEAFRYYCKSRNLTIDGSIADAVTTFTTGAFNAICNSIGINITQLQAEIYYRTKDNIGLQYLFTNEGVSFYNRIFAEFLQNNNLSVGDTVNNDIVYSGKSFKSKEGYSCLCFIGTGSIDNSTGSGITYYGTYLKYTGNDYANIYLNGSNNSTRKYSIQYTTSNTVSGNVYINTSTNANGGFYYLTDGTAVKGVDSSRVGLDGYSSVFYNPNNDKYYPCTYTNLYSGSYNNISSPHYKLSVSQYPLTLDSVQQNSPSINIYLTTNNNTINNNTYNDNDTTIINPDGTPDNDEPEEPEGPTVVPDPPNPTDNPDDWGIDFPGLNINWILNGMENKFPWDIPFNLLFCLSLLNAPPEAPSWEGDIDLVVYTWHIDFDLSEYEHWAEIVRDFELLAFCIGLMLLTNKLIWS